MNKLDKANKVYDQIKEGITAKVENEKTGERYIIIDIKNGNVFLFLEGQRELYIMPFENLGFCKVLSVQKMREV